MDHILVVNSENPGYGGRIYCPHCGVQVSQRDSRFCRACGADLKLVSEAMARQIPARTLLRTRLLDFFFKKRDYDFFKKRDYDEHAVYREGVMFLLVGAVFLANSIRSLVFRQERTVFWGAVLIVSLLVLKIGIANIRAYKRHLRGQSAADIKPFKGKLVVLEIDEKHSASNKLPEQTDQPGRLGLRERITALFDDEPARTK